MPELMQLLEGWEGYRPVGGRDLREAEKAQVIDLVTNAARMPRHQHEYLIKEAITTTDFPYLFGQVLEDKLLAAYRLAPPDWEAYTGMGTTPDFRTYQMHKVQGNEGLLPLVPEKGEYLVAPMSDAYYSNEVYKRGRQFDISWEATVNDILRAFNKMPERFANSATYTEHYQVTSLYAAAAGPNPLLFGAPITDVDGGLVTNLGALPLTIGNLETTMTLMAAQADIYGRVLSIRGMHLVVPPALEFTARAILTSALKQWTEVGAGGGIPVPTTNIIPQMGLQLHMDPMLATIDTSQKAGTTWYLFADPSEGEAIHFDRLQGHEAPEICMKASDKVSPMGAPLSPFSGDFASDNIFYRVRVVGGGTQMDPRYAYSQTGS